MKKRVVDVCKAIVSSMLIASIATGFISCAENADTSETESVETEVSTTTTVVEEISSVPEYSVLNSSDAYNVVSAHASDFGLSIENYPQNIIDGFVYFPDAYNFVLEFPLNSNGDDEAYEYPDISGEISKVKVPQLYQWDTRWAYRAYCGQPFGFNGSGPTCVSIAAIYVTGNTDLTPAWIMDYTINNSYCDNCTGTYRTLITSGAAGLGIDVVQITIDEDRVKRNLDVGNLIVCSMGEGVFSNPYESEHYIIITGYKDETFYIIDPASKTRTEQEWTWTGLAMSMNIPWVYRIM